jgi:hemerythrin-like domain-containing protein
MLLKNQHYVLEPDTVARCTPWMKVARRLKEEHEQLTEQLVFYQSIVKSINKATDAQKARNMLNMLKLDMTDCMRQLDEHSEWEEKEVFPVIDWYFGGLLKPSIMPSIWVMEKEHELGAVFVKSFIESVDELSLVGTMEQIQQATAHLVQACYILLEHFALEEELIFPLADQLLTDTDYFYS